VGDYSVIGLPIPAELRLYRSAGLSTGASGVLVSIPWDAESSAPPPLGFLHAAENITIQAANRYDLHGAATISAGSWTELRVEVQVDAGAGFVARFRSRLPNSAGVLDPQGPGTAPVACTLDLLVGNVVRVQVTAVGVASHPLLVGELETWIELRGRS